MRRHFGRLLARDRDCKRPAFSLPELLITVGIISLLVAMLLPALQLASIRARAARCASGLRQLDLALKYALNEYDYYPVWDDGAGPHRRTWMHVLAQCRYLGDVRVGICPADPYPGPVNRERGLHFGTIQGDDRHLPGTDGSYGISAVLSSGSQHYRPASATADDSRPRLLEDYERYPTKRLLCADGNWSMIYNLSGYTNEGHDWSYLAPSDNLIEWRHPQVSCNMLLQDGHVEQQFKYHVGTQMPVNTGQFFVWYPGEPINVGTDDYYHGNYYPDRPPVELETGIGLGFPRELAPGYYTYNRLWTVQIAP